MRRWSALGVPAHTALALSDQWPSIHGEVSQSTRSPAWMIRSVASQPPVEVASPVVTVRIAGTRRPASFAIRACASAATSASLIPGCASSLTAAWTTSERCDARRIASSSTGSLMRRAATTRSSTGTSTPPCARSTSATAVGSEDASTPIAPGPPARSPSARVSSPAGSGGRS